MITCSIDIISHQEKKTQKTIIYYIYEVKINMTIVSVGDYCISANPRERPTKVGFLITAEFTKSNLLHTLVIAVLFDNTVAFVVEKAFGIQWEWDFNNLSEKEKKIINEIMILYKRGHN